MAQDTTNGQTTKKTGTQTPGKTTVKAKKTEKKCTKAAEPKSNTTSRYHNSIGLLFMDFENPVDSTENVDIEEVDDDFMRLL